MKGDKGWAARMRQQAFDLQPFKKGDELVVRHVGGHQQEKATFYGFDSDHLAVVKFGLAGCRRIHMRNTERCPQQRGKFKESSMRFFFVDEYALERLDASKSVQFDEVKDGN